MARPCVAEIGAIRKGNRPILTQNGQGRKRTYSMNEERFMATFDADDFALHLS
jgi:hypothetical protein